MHAYWITGLVGSDDSPYAATMADATKIVKEHLRVRPDSRDEIRVELVEIETSKSAIIRMLNDEGQYQGPPIRTWRVGPRGGLVECKNGE